MLKLFQTELPNGQSDNLVMYSSLRSFSDALRNNNFGIKYVMDGQETYCVNGNKYIVDGRRYLLVNGLGESHIAIDSQTPVSGICIDLNRDMMAEVAAQVIAPDAPITDVELGRFFGSGDFIENMYDAQVTLLGQHLLKVAALIEKDVQYDYVFDIEFYYGITAALVQDQIPILHQFKSIRSVKMETKKDLWRKVSKGKTYIEALFASDLDMDAVAKEANISPFHFFRLFKETYRLSPYQYKKKLRLEKALQYMQQEDMPLSQVAMEVGYSDIFAFSKAFKSYYGKAPSSWTKTE